MRERLDEEIGTTTVDRRWEGVARRFGIPVAVAAVAAALAIGGYVVTTDDGVRDQPGGDPGVSGRDGDGPRSDVQPKPEAGVSAPIADPDQAYEKCIDLTVRGFNMRGEPVTGEPVGKLAIDDGEGITVVVANSTDSYACNIKPDNAVSWGNELDGAVQEGDFWFALNYTGNVLPGDKGDMVWAGGEVPEGVTGIRYVFPDGHTEDAVVQDGYWAMQYFSDRMIPSGREDRVEVTLDGADPQTFELPFTSDTMCNQISHGC